MTLFIPLSSVHAGESKDYTKKETVRVKCDAQGTVTKITVEDFLKLNNDKDSIIDYSLLHDIKNVEGDEQWTQNEDGTVIWENHGENIVYQGESDEPLPINVKITYYLNDQEIDPKDLAGQSGKLKIRFEYENTTQQKISIDGQIYDVHVPFVCTSALMLSQDHFQNIKVSQGKLMENNENTIVLAMAMPGIKDDLQLDRYEMTKDIDLNDYVEVSCDVEDFELDFTATIVSTIDLNEISALDQISNMTNGMKTLAQSSSKLLLAATKISQGMASLTQSFNQYFQSVRTLHQGIQTMNSSLHVITQQKQPLDETLTTVQTQITTLKNILKQINQTSDEQDIINTIDSLLEDSQDLSEMMSLIHSDLDQLETLIEDVHHYKDDIETYQTQLKNQLQNISLQDIEKNATYQAKQKMQNIIIQSDLSQEDKDKLLKEVDQIQITRITDQLTTQLQSIKNTIDDIPSLTIPDFHSFDLTTLKTTISHMEAQKEFLLQYLYHHNTKDLETIISQLSLALDDASSMLQSVETLSQAVDQLETASDTLSQGSQTLVTYQTPLQEALSSLNAGMYTFTEGYRVFDSQGIHPLASTDLDNLLARFKAIQKAEKNYNNYSGIQNECQGSVVFIYETDGIKK